MELPRTEASLLKEKQKVYLGNSEREIEYEEGQEHLKNIHSPWSQLAFIVLIRTVLAMEIRDAIANGQSLLHQTERLIVTR